MKIIPIITAIVVALVLYALVFERERLFDAAGVLPVTQTDAAPLPSTDDAPLPAGTVRVVALQSTARTIDNAVVLRGRTEAARQVIAAAQTYGTVISTPIRKGAYIEQGDVLCQLDPGTRAASLAEAKARLAEAIGRIPEANAAIAEAVARVREAEINVNAARQLNQDGFATQTRLVSAEATAQAAAAGVQRANSSLIAATAGIEAAEAAVAVATKEIERLTVTAPFAGLLETDTAELGTLMQSGSPCAQIVQLNPIKLVGFVPETEVDKISTGARANAVLSSGTPIHGRVTFLSRSADPTTRTFRVEVTAANDDLSIRDGQTVEVNVAAAGRTAHLLPQSALTLNDDGALGLRVVDADSITRFMPVTLLRDTVDGVWLSGLPDTVDVITVGQEFVIDGVPVAVTYATAAK